MQCIFNYSGVEAGTHTCIGFHASLPRPAAPGKANLGRPAQGVGESGPWVDQPGKGSGSLPPSLGPLELAPVILLAVPSSPYLDCWSIILG